MTNGPVSSVHLQDDGTWAICETGYLYGGRCGQYLVHLQNQDAAQLNSLPRELLEPLIWAVHPPDRIDEDGARVWHDHNGYPHSYGDLPAVIYPDGMREWCHEGKLHRNHDRPAIVYPDGERHWYDMGARHRANMRPAMIPAAGSNKPREYYVNDRPVLNLPFMVYYSAAYDTAGYAGPRVTETAGNPVVLPRS